MSDFHPGTVGFLSQNGLSVITHVPSCAFLVEPSLERCNHVSHVIHIPNGRVSVMTIYDGRGG